MLTVCLGFPTTSQSAVVFIHIYCIVAYHSGLHGEIHESRQQRSFGMNLSRGDCIKTTVCKIIISEEY